MSVLTDARAHLRKAKEFLDAAEVFDHDAFDAQVYIMSDTMVPEEMVAFGDDLLTNWT